MEPERGAIPFKLLILDMDGVMTTGEKFYDRNGDCVGKSFNDRDFTAINRFKEAGVKVCFLTGSQNINRKVATRRGIDFYYTGRFGTARREKASFIKDFMEAYNVSPAEMAFCGDDVPDVALLMCVGFAYCPRNVPRIVQDKCMILGVDCGDGVVAELFDLATACPPYGYGAK